MQDALFNLSFHLRWRHQNRSLWRRTKKLLKGLERGKNATLVFYHPETLHELPASMPVPGTILLSDICPNTEALFTREDVTAVTGEEDWIAHNILAIQASRDFRWLAVNANDKNAIRTAIAHIIGLGYGRDAGAHRTWIIKLVPES